MLDEIAIRIEQRQSKIPTRADISDLLASVGDPGLEQDEKRLRIGELFTRLGANPHNSQGHSVLDDLESYEEY